MLTYYKCVYAAGPASYFRGLRTGAAAVVYHHVTKVT
jgi:hypothetical protein